MGKQLEPSTRFEVDSDDEVKTPSKSIRVLKSKQTTEDLNSYEPNIDLRKKDDKFWEVKTVPEMLELCESREDIGLDARVMGFTAKGAVSGVKLTKAQVLESSRDNPRLAEIPIREAVSGFSPKKLALSASMIETIRKKDPARFREFNGFSDAPQNAGYGFSNAGLVGDDFVPLLGGPFNHQQYIYDYLSATSQSFYAYHHDPIARMIVETMINFSLGRSFRVDAKGRDAEMAQLLWEAVDRVNDFEHMMTYAARDLSLDGETMVWELPDHWSKIEYKLQTGQESPVAWLPRFRLIDPTVIWDIITYPEDITRVLSYQWVAPTQYQIYTRDKATNTKVPTLKFIYQQIPAAQVDHWKINCVSDEKRGRGDLYPVLGYLKRLRDTVNYSVISEQKASAWSIDTEIDGSEDDINAYFAQQQALGTIPPAGSEFIHSSKAKRTYLGNQSGGKSQASPTWEWCANMIATCTVPVNYWGISQSHGMSRASSMVSTEPVVKKFEIRRRVFDRILCRIFERIMERFGLEATCEVTFPEIVVQDRSAKLADIQLAEENGWFSKSRAATMASKEFDISEYEYDEEIQQINAEQALPGPMAAPLTTPGELDSSQEVPGGPEPKSQSGGETVKSSAHPESLDGKDKRGLTLGRGA